MLIIVESPAKAKTISAIVGKGYTVKASVGHIRRISDTKKTADGRALEINGIDIDNSFEPIFEVEDKKKDVVSELKKLAKQNSKIYFATDFDREGEAISWHLAEVLGIKDLSTIERLEFHEITDKAIKHALANPKPLRVGMVTAQKSRQVLDKLVGYKVSPLLWKVMSKNNLSAGRVQTPALKLVVDREREIKAFIPEEFWNLKGLFNKTKAEFDLQTNIENTSLKEKDLTLLENGSLYLSMVSFEGVKTDDLTNKVQVDKLLKNLDKNQEYTIDSLTNKTLTLAPKAPFITSTLQQSASSNLGYNPKRTMQIAQKLYEGVAINGTPTALITYMRTDSFNLSLDAVSSIRDWIKKNHPEALPPTALSYTKKAKNAQEAHEAIRPTDVNILPEDLLGKLEPEAQKLYDLIWRQTVSCQMTSEQKSLLNIKLSNIDKYEFSGTISWTTTPGYKILFPKQITYKPSNLDLKTKDVLFLNQAEAYQKFTQPPSRYSQASLIKELEKQGIGRPSTYASIITTLYDREYVINAASSKNSLQPTILGIKITEILEKFLPDLTSSVFTSQMEDKLDLIANQKANYVDVLKEFWEPLKAKVEKEMGTAGEHRDQFKNSETDEKCPTCDSAMTLKLGKFGEYLQCNTNADHKFKANYRAINDALLQAQTDYNPQLANHMCELCSKPLIVRVSNSSLNPYIACPDYRVGTKHTIKSVNFGPCPKCLENKRDGVLVKRKGFRSKSFIGCSLDKEICGYIQPNKVQAEVLEN
jgi:DNA topoisomerase I